jgi:hypothetical protein
MGKSQGIASKNVANVRAPKAEPIANRASVKGVSQIGQMLGNHLTEKTKILKGVAKPVFDGRRGYEPPVGPTDNVKAVGVAGGRNVYRSGQQGTHGSVNAGNPRPVDKGGWPDSKR